MNLYEITEEQRNLNSILEETAGELTPELEDALRINEENFAVKVNGYVYSIKNYKAEANAIAEEIERLEEKKKVCERNINRMKAAVSNAMSLFEQKKVQAGIFKVSLTSSKAVDIFDETLVPEKFKKQVYTYTISKTDIRNAIESGETVNGAKIVENHSITIK